MAQVYAIIHDGKGNFLIAVKNEFGYFFHSGKDGGKIIPNGQKLNGGGLPAFPGGKLEEKEALKGALKELLEETNIKDFEYKEDPKIFDGTMYYGVYLNVGDQIDKLLEIINHNLVQGRAAATAIQKKEITSYSQIFDKYHNCPLDNELNIIMKWNFISDKEKINHLKNNPATDWFYYIIEHLEENLYVISV